MECMSVLTCRQVLPCDSKFCPRTEGAQRGPRYLDLRGEISSRAKLAFCNWLARPTPRNPTCCAASRHARIGDRRQQTGQTGGVAPSGGGAEDASGFPESLVDRQGSADAGPAAIGLLAELGDELCLE